TGQLLETLLKTSYAYYGGDCDMSDYQFMAIAFNAFKTAGKGDQFAADAKVEFGKRLDYIITQYKPDIVCTFGLDPLRSLNGEKLSKYRNKRGIAYEHFYGVPITTTVKSKGEKHKFKHVPTLSLNPLINSQGKGDAMYL